MFTFVAKACFKQKPRTRFKALSLVLWKEIFLSRLDPGRGDLRGYLKTAITHYVANLRNRAKAEKRGGLSSVPLDFETAERTLAATTESPEEAYQRAWAQGVFERALERLKRDFESSQRTGPFNVILQYFQGTQTAPYSEIAAQHGMSVPQLKSFLHRARGRFRELVRDEVADTVSDTDDVDSEMQELIKAL